VRPISVVGMTNGAKKRKARRWAEAETSMFPSVNIMRYALARWAYRVGERLRPCCCLGCVYGYWPCSGVRPARGAR